MIILSNSIAQVVQPGQSATFDTVILKTGCAECFRPNSGVVRLNKNSIYGVRFGGNIGSVAAGTAQIAISLDNSPMLETTMIHTTTTAGDLDSVSRETAVRTCCCNGTISVINTGDTAINLGANPLLYIGRLA